VLQFNNHFCACSTANVVGLTELAAITDALGVTSLLLDEDTDPFVLKEPAALTSGALTVGVQYEIETYATDDDFTNVGALTNTVGTRFTATGTTPTHWHTRPA